MKDVARRHLASTPGTTLLLGASVDDVVKHFAQWRDGTWMDPADFLPNTLMNAPLPVYKDPPAGERRFAHINPQALWHPLFWLPVRLAGVYPLVDSKGDPMPEPEEMRSLRVALEMTASSLYDPEHGWVDTLALHGLDVDNPAHVERIARWQAGAPDDILDSINLDEHLLVDEDPHWALKSASALLGSYMRAKIALHSNSLIELFDDARLADSGKEMRSLAEHAAVLAGMVLGEIPGEEPGAATSYWNKVEQAAKSGVFPSRDAFLEGPMQSSVDYLSGIRDRYWPALDELRMLEGV